MINLPAGQSGRKGVLAAFEITALGVLDLQQALSIVCGSFVWWQGKGVLCVGGYVPCIFVGG